MKLLVISAAYPPMQAGEATNTYHLCRRLADQGIDVHVLTSKRNIAPPEAGIHVYPIMRSWMWKDMLVLRSFFRRCRPDAVYLMYLGLMYDYHPMITFAPTLAKRIVADVPFVTRYESAFVGADPSKTSFVSRAFRKYVVQRWAGEQGVLYGSGTLLRDSDYIVTLSERHRNMVMGEWPGVGSKVMIIPPPPNIRIVDNQNGGARRRGRQLLGVQEKDFVIAFLGYLYPVKGIDVLLRAFQLVAHKQQHVRLVFIGGKLDLNVEGGATYYESMQRLARELGINDRVIWTGTFSQEGEEGSLYLHAADMGVLPFIQGVQLNNSSFSCMAAHHLPVVVTLGSTSDKDFRHGENILSCPPGDHLALASCLERLIDDAALRQRLQVGIRSLANERFSWDKAVDLTLQLISDTAKAPQRNNY